MKKSFCVQTMSQSFHSQPRQSFHFVFKQCLKVFIHNHASHFILCSNNVSKFSFTTTPVISFCVQTMSQSFHSQPRQSFHFVFKQCLKVFIHNHASHFILCSNNVSKFSFTTTPVISFCVQTMSQSFHSQPRQSFHFVFKQCLKVFIHNHASHFILCSNNVSKFSFTTTPVISFCVQTMSQSFHSQPRQSFHFVFKQCLKVFIHNHASHFILCSNNVSKFSFTTTPVISFCVQTMSQSFHSQPRQSFHFVFKQCLKVFIHNHASHFILCSNNVSKFSFTTTPVISFCVQTCLKVFIHNHASHFILCSNNVSKFSFTTTPVISFCVQTMSQSFHSQPRQSFHFVFKQCLKVFIHNHASHFISINYAYKIIEIPKQIMFPDKLKNTFHLANINIVRFSRVDVTNICSIKKLEKPFFFIPLSRFFRPRFCFSTILKLNFLASEPIISEDWLAGPFSAMTVSLKSMNY